MSFEQKTAGRTVVVLDTETTGADPETAALVEVAGAMLDAPLGVDSCLANPGVPIPPEASATHHIVDADVAGAVSPVDAVSGCLGGQLIAADVWVAHNAAYDRGILSRVMRRFADESKWLCTWRCAMHVWPDAPSHKNQVLRYWLGLDVGELPAGEHAHRAAYDAVVTRALLGRLLVERPLDELLALQHQPVVQTKIRFGKHAGKSWDDVPTDYIQWMLRSGGFDPDVTHTAQEQMKNRASGTRMML